MTPETARSFMLTVIRQWRNPLMALANPMGEVLRRRQFGIIVLAMPHWIADSVLIDALAVSVKNVSRRPIAVVPGTMFRPALDKPGIYRSIKNYIEERGIVAVVGYPIFTVIDPTPDKARGFASGADYVVHTYPQLGEDVVLTAIRVHPCTKGMPDKPISIRSETLQESAHIDWEAREMGATVMTRTI
jgi:hypothetical protein